MMGVVRSPGKIKDVPVDTLISVLKRRLQGEPDISVRRFLINKAYGVARVYIGDKSLGDPDPDPFLDAVCCC